MNLSTSILTRTAATALAGTGLVAASVLGVQHASASSSTGTTTSTTTVADHPGTTGKAGKAGKGGKAGDRQTTCHRSGLRVGKAPEALKKDLAAARKKIRESDASKSTKATERHEALAAIRKSAEGGKYGKEVQQRVEKREQRVAKHRASLPEKLRSDLEALQKMAPGTARREAAEKIRKARLDGTYGAQVKEHAEKAEKKRAERKQACQAQRQQRQEKKGSGSSAAQGGTES